MDAWPDDPGGLTDFSGYDLTGTGLNDAAWDPYLDLSPVGLDQYQWALDDSGGQYQPRPTWDLPSVGSGAAAIGQSATSPNWLNALTGAAPGLLSLLAGGLNTSRGTTTTPALSTAQKALATQSQGALGAMQPGANTLWNSGTSLLQSLAGGTTPLQEQQASILSALAPTAANLASGNVKIPQSLRDLVASAFEPDAADIATKAIESARKRGFAGGAELLNTGPGGAIAGPALSDLAGHQSQSLLNAMIAFPKAASEMAGAYNTPIQQQQTLGSALLAPQQQQVTGYNSLFSAYPSGKTTSGDYTGLANSASQALSGGLQGYQLNDQTASQSKQQKGLLDILKAMMADDGTTMSGTR